MRWVGKKGGICYPFLEKNLIELKNKVEKSIIMVLEMCTQCAFDSTNETDNVTGDFI